MPPINDNKKSKWSILWLIWIASFLAIELPAALNKQKNDTLSEHVWMWVGGKWIRRLIVAIFMVALTLHFVFKLTVLSVILSGIGIIYLIIRWWNATEWSEGMEFSIPKALWKAIRSALLASLVIFLSSGGIDVFIDNFVTNINPILPIWSVPLVAAVVTIVRNFIKQYVASLPKGN